MSAFAPSVFQQAIFDAVLNGDGNFVISAVAGSGKTRTIVELTKRIPLDLRSSCFLTAFNKSIEMELSARKADGRIPSEITIQTIHGLGYKILRNALRVKDTKNWVDGKKYQRLSAIYWRELEYSEETTREESYKQAVSATARIVELAMLNLADPNDKDGLVSLAAHYGTEYPLSYEERILAAVPQILKWGREGLRVRDEKGKTYHPAETISYADMIYLPIALNCIFPHYKIIIADEAQDLNRCQQELLLRLKGRIIAVGDPQQAIYGFAGADAESFHRIKKMTNAIQLPLSICYRCSKAVVEFAKTFVPQIEAAPDAPQGAVITAGADQMLELAKAHFRDENLREKPFMILCRINADLITAAFSLISQGIPARVVGRDIGEALIKMIDIISEQTGFKFDEFEEYAARYRAIQVELLEKRDNSEMAIADLCDRVDSILAVHAAARTAGRGSIQEMRSFINDLFAENEKNAIIFSSIHRAKGLEADTVCIMRTDLMPHPMARQAWELEQEVNLGYVAGTRAKLILYVDGPMRFGAEAAPVAAPVAEPEKEITERERVEILRERLEAVKEALDPLVTSGDGFWTNTEARVIAEMINFANLHLGELED